MKIKIILDKFVNKILLKTDWYNDGFWKGTTKFWRITSCDYDVINLGSNSGKHAFCYDNLPVKGMNWAIGPQSLVHDFNILKNYFSYLKEGGVVLIPLSPFSCLHSSYSKDSNFKYYPILHPATIIDFDDSERTKAYKIKANPFKEMPGICLKNTFKEIILKSFRLIKRSSCISYDKNAGMWINLWKNQFGLMDLDSPLCEKHLKERSNRAETLRDMVLFCQERDLKPYIVLTPIHPTLRSYLSQSFMKNYIYDFISEATDDNTILLDYMSDSLFTKDEYYLNAFFLNDTGAKVFTNKVIADLGLI